MTDVTRIISAADLDACPINSLLPTHFEDDGKCLCTRYVVVDDLTSEPFGPFGVVDTRPLRRANPLLAVYKSRRGAESYRSELIERGVRKEFLR